MHFIQILNRFFTDFIPQKIPFLDYKIDFSQLYKIPILSILVSNWVTYNQFFTSRKSVEKMIIIDCNLIFGNAGNFILRNNFMKELVNYFNIMAYSQDFKIPSF